jgi:lipoic acid synthetase
MNSRKPFSEQADADRPLPTRLPEWLKVSLPKDGAFARTAQAVAGQGLHTVCRQARCPNIFECFGHGVATFLILGDSCTRSCGFCNVTHATPAPPDPEEPKHLAKACAELQLKHVVITSVTRDDLPDGGAAQFAACIRAVRHDLPTASIEVLIPDFQGAKASLQPVLDAKPDVLNHNLETVPELYATVRPKALYARSLELLSRAKDSGGVRVKSGLMLGLGESRQQLFHVLGDLARIGCDIVTVGQYLRPSRRNLSVVRYVPPFEFDEVAQYGRSLGIPVMYCGPLVRSSHNAGPVAAAALIR